MKHWLEESISQTLDLIDQDIKKLKTLCKDPRIADQFNGKVRDLSSDHSIFVKSLTALKAELDSYGDDHHPEREKCTAKIYDLSLRCDALIATSNLTSRYVKNFFSRIPHPYPEDGDSDEDEDDAAYPGAPSP